MQHIGYPPLSYLIRLLTRNCLLFTAFVLAIQTCPSAHAQFIPGSGGSVPDVTPLVGIPDQIGGLRIEKNQRKNNTYNSGTHANLELKFPPPSEYGADGYTLQRSVDGSTGWVDQIYNGVPLVTSSTSADNWSFTPEGDYYYRLLVSGGDHDEETSNVVFAAVSEVNTQFWGWGMDESMWLTGTMSPWVGRGLEASFTVRDLSDNSTVEGGLSYQWYRVNPISYEMVAIDGATEPLYITTSEDLGGWLFLCRATGNDSTVGGFCQIMSNSPVLIPNNSFASNISHSGFRLNLDKSVSSLTPADLELSYWDSDNFETVYLSISSVTPVAGNASFDVSVLIPDGVTQVYLECETEVMAIGQEMGDDEFSMFMQGLSIDIPTGGYDSWASSTPGIPEDNREPLDRNGPFLMQNIVAYTMGINPMTVTQDQLPELNSLDPVAGTLHIIYRRAKNLTDATLTPRISTDLEIWDDANVVSESVIEDGGDWEKVDALVEFEAGPKGFLRFKAEAVN